MDVGHFNELTYRDSKQTFTFGYSTYFREELPPLLVVEVPEELIDPETGAALSKESVLSIKASIEAGCEKLGGACRFAPAGEINWEPIDGDVCPTKS